jgi:DNA cross-link repair 1A protein
LTHYHGDHYSGLARENKYNGPALIHCTPVTAALLRNIHQVPVHLVVEHEYGTPWTHRIMHSDDEATVSFHDANHCPGAAIVLIELPDETCHLHTGDMRYHAKMKSYSLLQRAVERRKLGVVYLDTTYGHPKHDFTPQHVAVDAIASYAESALEEVSKKLILLSCYSIGKEKVLWETSKRCNQLVYVSERKHKMLQCVKGGDDSSRIHTRCTLDPSQSDIHVIPMGMAGEIWPYFRPNYRACADYAEKLEKKYDRVVAFLPTGWANASNWNKKNAVSKKQMEFAGRKGHVDIEIRLVSYSEHSSFLELCSFVEYLRPRQIVPTVFSDENDRRKIESHFRKLVDTSRAKQHFFKAMKSPRIEKSNRKTGGLCGAEIGVNEVEVIEIDSTSPPDAKKQKRADAHVDELTTLISMGFDSKSAQQSLARCGGNLETALEDLLKKPFGEISPAEKAPGTPSDTTDSKATPTLKDFFSPKGG